MTLNAPWLRCFFTTVFSRMCSLTTIHDTKRAVVPLFCFLDRRLERDIDLIEVSIK
jgi:hypothetical protein